MTDKEKIEFLKSAMSKLKKFSSSLNDNNLEEFKDLQSQIKNVLSENEKIRFEQIEFYEEQIDFNNIMSDDLPF